MLKLYVCTNTKPYRPMIVARSPHAAESAMRAMLTSKGWVEPELPPIEEPAGKAEDGAELTQIIRPRWTPAWRVYSADQPGAYLVE